MMVGIAQRPKSGERLCGDSTANARDEALASSTNERSTAEDAGRGAHAKDSGPR
jgi:hypothetical protein